MSLCIDKDPLDLDNTVNELNETQLKKPIVENGPEKTAEENVHQDNSQICLLCLEGFSPESLYCKVASRCTLKKENLLDHIQVVHSSEAKEQCLLCRNMIKREDYSKHMNAKHRGYRIFRCKICSNRFANRSKLDDHVKKIHERQEKPFECEICYESFKVRDDIQEHMSSIHNKVYKCQNCVKCYGTIRDFNVHIETHMFSSIKNQTKTIKDECNADSQREINRSCDIQRVKFCFLCEKSFVSFAELEKHTETHVEDEPFECPFCADLFEDLNVFKDHVFKHTTNYNVQESKNREDIDDSLKKINKTINPDDENLSDEERHTVSTSDLNISNEFLNEAIEVIRSDVIEQNLCDLYGKAFESEEILNKHLEEHGEIFLKGMCKYCGEHLNSEEQFQHYKKHEDEALFTLSKCEDSSVHKQDLSEHVKLMHDTDHECTICGLTFKANDKFLEHYQTHSSTVEHSCDICKRTFTNLTIFNNHKLMHSKKEEFQCYVCGIFFKFNGNLKVHMRIHTGEKPYKCKLCNKTFARIANLNEHLRTHNKIRSYQCKYCDKKFHTSSSFSKHEKSHFINKRNHVCSICDKSFLQKVHLSNHIRTHTRENPFKCNICGKFYRRKDVLKQHHKLHLKNKDVNQCEVNSDENVIEINQDSVMIEEQ